jgi:hypothetical protein
MIFILVYDICILIDETAPFGGNGPDGGLLRPAQEIYNTI